MKLLFPFSIFLPKTYTMRKFVIFILIIFSRTASAQYFDGVKIDGDLTSVIRKYQQKGYKLYRNFDGGATLKGTAAGIQVELYAFVTPISKKVWKVVVYLPEYKTWHGLKGSFTDHYNLLVSKYGEPKVSLTDFDYPYEEGDGYEISAVKLEKCRYAAYWESINNTNIGIAISEFACVKITYENSVNANLMSNELDKKNRQVFKR